MQLNPKEIIEKKILIPSKYTKIQQVGIDLTIKDKIIIPAKGFVNVLVNEKFDMQNTFGLIVIRSSLSRQGIFCTSGVYDPGFNGVGGVSIYNLSEKQVELVKGFRIGQMICFEANPAKQYTGFYNKNQTHESKYKEVLK